VGTFLLAFAIGVIVLWGVLTYNGLVRDRNRTASAWSDIDVQLQRRHDLIPRLVEAVRAYAQYERATLETVTELRAKSEQTRQVARIAELEQQIEAGMWRLVALAEDYPDLKADRNFLELQHELTDVEDHLQYARRYYNGAARLFNTRIQSFPDLLVARPLGFAEAEFFDAAPEAEAPVKVSLA
jgi:LemA protein